MTGVVKRMMREKGFGFIRDSQTGQEYFFHRSSVRDHEYDQLLEGDSVSFEPSEGQKGPRAEDVERHIEQ